MKEKLRGVEGDTEVSRGRVIRVHGAEARKNCASDISDRYLYMEKQSDQTTSSTVERAHKPSATYVEAQVVHDEPSPAFGTSKTLYEVP